MGIRRRDIPVSQVPAGQLIRQHGARAILHVRLDLLTFAVERIELMSNFQSTGFVVRDEALNAERHILKPSRSIQSWAQRKTQVIGRCLAEIPLGNPQKSINPCAAVSVANTSQSLMYEDPIVIIEF